jgi:hypothetical protein
VCHKEIKSKGPQGRVLRVPLKRTQELSCLGKAHIFGMRASLVTQPDGSSALILSDSRRGASDVSTEALSARQQTSFPEAVSTTSTLDPFNAQDMVAEKELLRMRQQDASMRAQHASIDAVSVPAAGVQ